MAHYALPAGWEWKALGEVAQFVPGVVYGKGDMALSWQAGFTPLLRANNIQKKLVVDQDLVFVPSSMVKPGQFLLEGDILVAKYSGSRDLVGKSARLDFGTVATFGTFCAVVRVKKGVDSRFVAHFFQSPAYREKISAVSQGAAIGNLRREDLENIAIPLPSDMAEQSRLVSKIDAVLSLLDGAIAVQKDNLNRTASLRQSLLAEVFGPMEGGAEPRPLSFFGKISPGGTPPRQTAAYWNGEIDWFTSGELNTHTVRESREKISALGLKNSKAKMLEAGTLLIGLFDTAAFKMSILEKPAACNQAVVGIRPCEKILDMAFLKYQLEYLKPTVLMQRQGVQQQNLNAQKIKDIKILLPELAEQSAVAARIARSFSAIDRLEKAQGARLSHIEGLKKSVLESAFRGEL